MAKILAVLVLMLGGLMARAENVTFDTQNIGTVPTGWEAGSTGGGSPKWSIGVKEGSQTGGQEMPGISAEAFVTAVAGKNHSYILASETREQ